MSAVQYCEWTAAEVNLSREQLPLALNFTGLTCMALHLCGYTCSRLEGHAGRHAAHGARYVLAVWA